MNRKIKFGRKTLVIYLALMMILSIFVFPSGANGVDTYDYVIITTNAIVEGSEELDHFIYTKEFQGHGVKVVTEDDFGPLTGEPPNQVPEKIREWLKYYYVGYGIDYVLLIGDPDPDDPKDPSDHIGDIPMKMTSGLYFTYWDWHEPTDYYYADLQGNWDLDGDGFFGEVNSIDAPQSPIHLLILITFQFSGLVQ